jgi:hypothetical protein
MGSWRNHHLRASMSRCPLICVCTLGRYSLAPYWLQWLEELAYDSVPCPHAADLKQFATAEMPWEQSTLVVVLETFIDAVTDADGDSTEGFLAVGTLPIVVRWMFNGVSALPPGMLLRGSKLVRQLLQYAHTDLNAIAMSDEEIGMLVHVCTVAIDRGHIDLDETSTDDDVRFPVPIVILKSPPLPFRRCLYGLLDKGGGSLPPRSSQPGMPALNL